MHGSLSLRGGILYVGRHADTAHVRAYDLDGMALTPGFAFRSRDDEGGARVSGLDVDRDRTLWIADGAASRVRAFSVFGQEVSSFSHLRNAPHNDTHDGEDRRGDLSRLSDVALLESDDEDRLIVVCGGRRRHALSLARTDGTWCASLRSEGDALGTFRGLSRASAHGRWIWACETDRARVQVFRDGEFHFLFRVPVTSGARVEPVAAAPVADGRWVLAVRGETSALLIVDSAGRLIRVLASQGDETGSVENPEDVVVEQGADVTHTRVAVLDRDAERVQVFTVEGRCYGAVEPLPGEAL
ncbi:MAG TPA: hypothetical protein VM509_15615 [Planctomycetota bacterium]|nr:hypothetical protein [Planctomycetota bacterium]